MSASRSATIDDLPVELVEHIVSFVGFGDRLRCQKVSKKFRQALRNDSPTWRSLSISLPRVSENLLRPVRVPKASERKRHLRGLLQPKMAKVEELLVHSNLLQSEEDAMCSQFCRLGGEVVRVALRHSARLRRLDVTAALEGSGVKLARVLKALPRLQHLQWHMARQESGAALPALPRAHPALVSLHVGILHRRTAAWQLPPALASRLTRLVALGWHPSDGAWAVLGGAGQLRELRLLAPAHRAPPQLSALTSLRSLAVAACLDGYKVVDGVALPDDYRDDPEDAIDTFTCDTVVPSGIAALTSLTRLELGWRTAVDKAWELQDYDIVSSRSTVFTALERLPHLRHLALRYGRLLDVPVAISSLSILTALDLSRNCMSTLPAWLGQLPRLEVVDAGESSLPYVNIEARLALAPRLREVRVGAHHFGGDDVPAPFTASVIALDGKGEESSSAEYKPSSPRTAQAFRPSLRFDAACWQEYIFQEFPSYDGGWNTFKTLAFANKEWQLNLGSAYGDKRPSGGAVVAFAEAALRGMREHGDVLARLEGLLRYDGSPRPGSFAGDAVYGNAEDDDYMDYDRSDLSDGGGGE